MLGYDFEIKYKPITDNKVDDALSHVSPTVHLAYLSTPTLLDINVIRDEVLKDPKLSAIILQLQKDDNSVSWHTLHHDVLRFKNRLVLFKNSSLIPTILHTYHDSVFGGHLSFLRTYKQLLGELYWEGMKNDVK